MYRSNDNIQYSKVLPLLIFMFLIVLNVVVPAFSNEISLSGLDSRPTNTSCFAPDRPVTNTDIAIESVVNFGQPTVMIQAPGNNDNWYIADRSGEIKIYKDGTVFNVVGSFVDLSDRVSTLWNNLDYGELGLLGIAFHPDFNTNGQVFLYYTTQGETAEFPIVARLSRFSSLDNGLTLDPSSEEVLISINHTRQFHKGGDLKFGKDGYLYLGLGDGGQQLEAQKLNSLLGKMIRIDVSATSGYTIPADNPFTQDEARPEIYALGLRNPWRWSFDKETNEIWLGDVGWNSYEEINYIVKGGNYGWGEREGAHCTVGSNCQTEGLSDPVVEYPHGDGGQAVIGGYVYRGDNIPSLRGTYLFADGPSGIVSKIVYDDQGNASIENIFETGRFVTAFAESLSGELYILTFGKILRINSASETTPTFFPQKLSETGCMDPADVTKPGSGLIPYDVNVELWSDGAEKLRWMALPDGESIHIDDNNDWSFPIGTVLVKGFKLGGEFIETRLLVRHDDGDWGGYSYEWNDEQTEAFLLLAGKVKEINGQSWTYPSRSQCFQCHTTTVGRAIGPETLQLNGLFTYPNTGRVANQVETLSHIGMFDAALVDTVDNLPTLPRIDDETVSVDKRARAYLHANCQYCHQPGGSGQGPEDFRYTTPGELMGALNEIPTQGDFGIEDAKLVSPGKPEKSILSYRLHTLETGRMPPLGSSVVDGTAATLIDDWIRSGLGFNIPDTDGDGFADNVDNCVTFHNPRQIDTNADGFGNACDGDFNGDLLTNVFDLTYFKHNFFTNDPHADLNGDGFVNTSDLTRFKQLFFKPPGPSGILQ